MQHIELTPVEVKPVKEQVIKINNERIGTVVLGSENCSFKYHAILDSRQNVYQGFGQTIDEALRDAITKSRALRKRELIELDNLENVIWGDHELN